MRRFIIVVMIALALTGVACKAPEIEVALVLLSETDYDMFPVWEKIELEFNRRVKAEEINIDVEPAIQFRVDWGPDGRKVTIIPESNLAYAAFYSFNVCGHSFNLATPPIPSITLVAGGDVLLDKLPGQNIAMFGPDYVFAGMGDLLTSADISFANLESPASNRGEKIAPKSFTFRSTPQALDALVEASIDVVSFTNNHCLDYGLTAFADTLEHLKERSIAYVGAGKDRAEALRPHIVEINGLSVAFLAFTERSFLPAWSYDLWEARENKPGVVFMDGPTGRADLIKAVKDTVPLADVILVSLHWGAENTTAPKVWQQELAREVIDAGATAILGHHPHMPFGVEVYSGKPIIYSLGNFLFHPYDKNARHSFVAHLDITMFGEVQTTLYPILMEEGTVRLLIGEEAQGVLQTIATRSQRLGSECIISDNILEIKSAR